MGKSKLYKGVYQREKEGTWHYRFKRIPYKNAKPVFYHGSGFETEQLAYEAKIKKIREIERTQREAINTTIDHSLFSNTELLNLGFETEQHTEQITPNNSIIEPVTFETAFRDFMRSLDDGNTSKEKYLQAYNAQLYIWKDKDITQIKDSDIDILFLRLFLRGISESRINLVRKVLKLVFRFSAFVGDVPLNLMKPITTSQYRLRVMSLFSGIGAPEQALKNLGIDYELVNFCEIDRQAKKAYCILHGVPKEKNLGDIKKVDFEKSKEIPRFDIMFFGFPCQNISKAGKRNGFVDKKGNLTQSGLFFKAMDIAKWKRPKFMIAENVANLKSEEMAETFATVMQEFRDTGYTVYEDLTVNSIDYGIPQNRKRVFIVLVRNDLDIDFKFVPPTPKSEFTKEEQEENEDWLFRDGWISDGVDDEYYVDMSQEDLKCVQKLKNRRSFKYEKGYIKCLTTGCGAPSYDRTPHVKDSKGIRCLTSEELMKFQGFPPEYGTRLRQSGITRNQVGKLVGNSITVDVIQEILRQFFAAL